VCLWRCVWLQGSGTQVTREMETQVLITALALPYGGKILFAATELGAVRCYKYPLTGEHKVSCNALSYIQTQICIGVHHP
jgi:hypothetical protein